MGWNRRRTSTGSITGLSILIGKITGMPFTIFYYGLSALVLGATHLLLGRQESKKILLLSVLFPITLTVFDQWLFTDASFNLTGDDLFLSSVYFGVIAGIGAGLILLRGYSSGGTDSIGKILHKRFFPFVSISQLIAKQISSLDKDAFVTAMPVISVWGRGVGFESMQA